MSIHIETELDQVLSRFYEDFKSEAAEYSDEMYYTVLLSMAYQCAEELEVPPEILIKFVRSIH